MQKLIVILAALALSSPAAGAPRTARCLVASAGNPTWEGPCRFDAERGGSFTISAPERFGADIEQISVTITSPGVAEVRGLTADGIISRWGTARRSRRDRACWTGEDFNVCIY